MADSKSKKIAVITGSTRVVRIGDKVTKFVTDIIDRELFPLRSEKSTSFTLSHVDIAAFHLPVFDEPVIPAAVPEHAQFVHDHSKAWSAEMAKYDGYILVTAEYNGGPPGGVKNALDYLYNEIKGKPWLIISYGVQGGLKSSASLKGSLQTVFAHVVETSPALPFSTKGEPVFGLPYDLSLTWRGELGESSLSEWKGKRGEIVKGFEELKEYLVKPVETSSNPQTAVAGDA